MWLTWKDIAESWLLKLQTIRHSERKQNLSQNDSTE